MQRHAVTLLVVLASLATNGQAHAAPKAVVHDPLFGSLGSLRKTFLVLRPPPLFERNARDVEAFVWMASFQAPGMSSFGLSLAAAGALTGATVRAAKLPAPLTLGPRFYRSGGGFVLSLRF